VRLGFNAVNKNEVFAVKIVDASRVNTRKAKQDLQNEIDLLGSLKSPFIVQLKAYKKISSKHYIVMELCNGGDLKNLIDTKGGYLAEREARNVLEQILCGLVDLRQQEIVHRDLKSANIMLNFSDVKPTTLINNSFNLGSYLLKFDYEKQFETLSCKITDLGIARKMESN